MGIYRRGAIYWYKFGWQGKLVRESTRQGYDKVARQMERAHFTRLAKQKDEREAAAQELGCSEVLKCSQCAKWFDSTNIVKDGSNRVYCGNACMLEWKKSHTVIPTLAEFIRDGFEPWAREDSSTNRRRHGTRCISRAFVPSRTTPAWPTASYRRSQASTSPTSLLPSGQRDSAANRCSLHR